MPNLSNWSGWHTVAVILGAVGASTAYIATHGTGIDPTLLSVDQFVAQIDSVLLMVVSMVSGSALASKAVAK